jgi:hypothetical protein
MAGPTTNVTITLVGVRIEQLARLKTVVKGQLTRFANSYTVEDDQPPKPPARKK